MTFLGYVLYALSKVVVKGKFSEEELVNLKNIASVRQTEDAMPYIEGDDCSIQMDRKDILDMMECMEERLEMPNDMKSITKELEKIIKQKPIEQIRGGKRTFFIFFANKLTANQKMQIMRARENGQFYFISSNKKMADDIGVSFPGVYAYNVAENAVYKVPLDNSYGTVMTPIFSVLTTEAVKNIDDSKLPAFYIFYNGNNDKQLKKELFDIAYDYREKYKFGMIKYVPDKTELNNFKINEDNLPALVHLANDKKYRLAELTKSTLKQFLKEYEKGTVKPFVRSEAVPDEQKDLKKVVGATHDAFVNDKERDTLLVYGSEKCGFCRELLPVLEKIAEKTKNNSKVKIGYINMYENDVESFSVKAYPTIVLYPAGKKEPIEYKEFGRSEENLINFIKKSGSWQVDLNEDGQNVPDDTKKKGIDAVIEDVKKDIKEKIEDVKKEL